MLIWRSGTTASSWPLLCAVQDTNDFDDWLADAIDDGEGKLRN